HCRGRARAARGRRISPAPQAEDRRGRGPAHPAGLARLEAAFCAGDDDHGGPPPMTTPRRPWWKPRRSRAVQRVALLVVLVCLGMAAWALHAAYTRVIEYPDRPGSGSAELIDVEIPKGASFPQVLELLVEHGVVPEADAWIFKLYVL